MAEQLSFPLREEQALGRDHFFTSAANELAVQTLDQVTAWPNQKLILQGPLGSGKTHLARIWAQDNAARIIAANDVTEAEIPSLVQTALVLEDIDRIEPPQETALFHLHNLILAEGRPLLMTTTTFPSETMITLPDLLSRLQGTALVSLNPPDEALLRPLLARLFSDRQIAPPTGLIDYILARMEGSFDAAHWVVEALDTRALQEGRPIGKGLAGEILDPERRRLDKDR